MASVSYSNLWGPVNFAANGDPVDQIDSDFLMMEIEVPVSVGGAAAHHDDSFLSRDGDNERRNSLGISSIVIPNERAQSPLPEQRESFNYTHEITPEKNKNEDADVNLPNVTDLQQQYQNTLKKLAKSMRRSDMTRSVIKRQRKVSPSLSFDSTNAPDFFASKELEQDRKHLFQLIHTQDESVEKRQFRHQETY